MSIAAFGIDVGAGLNEEMTKSMVTINCSPLYTISAPRLICFMATSNVRTWRGVMPCSSVDLAEYRPLSKSF